jgi:hypothetical protein
MATFVQRGVQDAVFGIVTVVNFLYLEQVDEDLSPEFMAEMADQNGICVGKVYGPTKPTASFQGTLKGTPAVAGSVFTFNGLNYIVEKVTRVQKNKDFVKSSFDATAYPGIPNP